MSIDSSTNKTGIAIYKNGELINFILIDCSKNKIMNDRFKEMSIQLLKQLDIDMPAIIYIEETVVLRNAQTQRFLTRLQGVVYAWCIRNNCEFNTIRPTEWRKELSFSQGRNIKREQMKQQSIQYVKNRYNLDVNDDVADAICIGEAVLHKIDNLD